MLSSFFISSAFKGPTPFKYSIGLDNMLAVDEIGYCFYKYISFVGKVFTQRRKEN
ncbi:MAG TPA: hypothetical protein VK559_01945 [Ferruginibacter sp.]|nr:hypothetical protein [Ferruginibacter sp.]